MPSYQGNLHDLANAEEASNLMGVLGMLKDG
jgi:hypothetical protein